MDEHIDAHRCHVCLYDVSQTVADGFTICPECGVTIAPRGEPVLRNPAALVRMALMFFSVFPSVLVLVLMESIGDPDAGAVAVMWMASIVVIHVVNLCFERWRSPIQAHDRALGRTVCIIALHIAIPIAAVTVVLVLSSIVIC